MLVRVSRRSCEDGPLLEDQETEGQRQLHSLLLQQLHTEVDIDRSETFCLDLQNVDLPQKVLHYNVGRKLNLHRNTPRFHMELQSSTIHHCSLSATFFVLPAIFLQYSRHPLGLRQFVDMYHNTISAELPPLLTSKTFRSEACRFQAKSASLQHKIVATIRHYPIIHNQ